ncbi:hypothetical protein METBIDRAFT_34269 [Metschnikowia bicuspidata var. bicuspidata NRRL YB-4993]|uniref:DUF2415 domain-containing protein n=1 Tax=Metschnikowia bicuspidata var. bicuspidata NRRL YB-4993 TaxID=869754 RepID=A0A1A0HGD3_9ASCO|nr:hypothetical protein METBIDRAFT_34269 [Metschnikowia bicuspidata var. bicuspidata NRRL YB-4993]OBA23224.1 hypothetical protein METBIDRAFT_34269 [Metschnikowia bicuspidata var. bicuspidata NRRL YB-4993]
MTIGLAHPPQPRKNSSFSTADRRGLALSVYRCFQNYYHGLRLLGPDPQYIGNVRLSINHWQIRDLVQVDESTGAVFHTLDEHIRVMTMKTRSVLGPIRTRNHVSLPYRPRCFHHAAGGLVVAGGVLTTLARACLMGLANLTLDFLGPAAARQARGLFSVHSPAMGAEMSFLLGGMINNAVKIYAQQNSAAAYTAYACNNDLGLYRIDVSDAGVRGDRRIVCDPDTSLNNVHLSADGRMLTATGDSGAVFLVDPALPDPVVRTISTPHDSGFGISYHRNELVFATAFQDGTCCMFDLRNTSSPLHEVRSTRAGHQLGAFRTCRFLHSPVHDLLAVLEHLGRVHLVDVRDLLPESHQVMVFPFALDQYARCGHVGTQLDDDFATDTHRATSIYNDGAAHFPAPLVYDHDYLADVNPNLFRGYTYEPQQAAAAPSLAATRRAQELYRQSVSHVNGEMEIAGLDWLGNQLLVGCEDGGFLVWDVNLRARRSLGSFSYV